VVGHFFGLAVENFLKKARMGMVYCIWPVATFDIGYEQIFHFVFNVAAIPVGGSA
jgi:hypothetical protein